MAVRARAMKGAELEKLWNCLLFVWSEANCHRPPPQGAWWRSAGSGLARFGPARRPSAVAGRKRGGQGRKPTVMAGGMVLSHNKAWYR